MRNPLQFHRSTFQFSERQILLAMHIQKLTHQSPYVYDHLFDVFLIRITMHFRQQ